jgi:hypothetical protein
MTDRKKPGWAFWAVVVLVALPVLYVASFGPACWLARDHLISDDVAVDTYRPLIHVANCGPSRIRRVVATYSGGRGNSDLGCWETMLDSLTRRLDFKMLCSPHEGPPW